MAAEEQTIEEQIAADWKAIQEKHAVKDEPEPEPAAEVAAEEPTEPVAEERPRDETGKFAKKTETAKEPEPAKAPVQATTSPEAAPAPELTRDLNRPPSSWKPTAKSVWDKLPTEIKAEVQRREADFLNGQAKLLPDAKFGASLRQVISPYQSIIDAEGGTPEGAVSDLLRTAAMLRMGTPQQKTAAVRQIVAQFGVDLSTLLPSPADPSQTAPQPTSFTDPRVDQLLAQMQQQETLRKQQERQSIERVAADWIAESDAAGKPLRPYVDDVMQEMNALVPQIRASDPSKSHKDVLQEAYDRAVWAHPEIQSILQKEKIEQLEAKRRTENQERVTLARKASSVNVPRRGSVPNPAKPGSMDDTIRDTARALGLVT